MSHLNYIMYKIDQKLDEIRSQGHDVYRYHHKNKDAIKHIDDALSTDGNGYYRLHFISSEYHINSGVKPNTMILDSVNKIFSVSYDESKPVFDSNEYVIYLDIIESRDYSIDQLISNV